MSVMRFIFISVFLLNGAIALKFCANRHYACVDDAVAICTASGRNYCTNVMNGMTWQYSVDGVSGCHKFQSREGGPCHISGTDIPDQPANCFPLHRNYCECTPCTDDTDCLAANIKDGNGNPAGCEDAVNMTNTSYFKGVAAGKQCGIDNCANALKMTYNNLDNCL